MSDGVELVFLPLLHAASTLHPAVLRLQVEKVLALLKLLLLGRVASDLAPKFHGGWRVGVDSS